jgi:toxin ParE1/3/4
MAGSAALKQYSIVWMAEASADLRHINQWLSDLADRETADRYVDEIYDHASRLTYLPLRGAPRPDLGDGLRSMEWRQRATILYRVTGTTVEIVAIRYAGQDWSRLLQDR